MEEKGLIEGQSVMEREMITIMGLGCLASYCFGYVYGHRRGLSKNSRKIIPHVTDPSMRAALSSSISSSSSVLNAASSSSRPFPSSPSPRFDPSSSTTTTTSSSSSSSSSDNKDDIRFL
mmetsp:Transcript_3112/g.4583  ORF Transcript_3112/g.4583 Transcript_3112/m.4583 type:complete len:119 (-) Transcript_3112:423-779(-)